MGTLFLILGLACFIPLFWSMGRRIFRAPETISTPAWLLSTNSAFILAGPVVAFLFLGEDLTSSPRGAATVTAVLLGYSVFLALSYFAVAKVVGAMNLASAPPVSAVAVLRQAADSIRPAEVFLWSGVVMTIQVLSFALYSLGLTGGNMAYDYKLNIPYWFLVLYMLFGQATLGLATLLSRIAFGQFSLRDRALAAAILLTEFGLTILSGRRELIWLTVAITFGIIWSGRRRWVAAMPFAVGIVYVVLFVFAPVFLRARLIYSGGNAPSVLEAYSIALNEREGDLVGQTDLEAQRNTSWRFRTYAFWEQYYEEKGPAFTEGKILMQAGLVVLPRGIFGLSKFALGVVDENLLETKYDICNNVSLESYVDLGVLGPAAYGLMFGAVFALCDSCIVWAGSRYRMMAVLAAGSMVRQLLGPEANPIAYFSELRSCLIFAILAAFIAMLFGRRPFVGTKRTPFSPGRPKAAGRCGLRESLALPGFITQTG
jgi:hypothetical protein